MLPVFKLLAPIEDVRPPGELVETVPHDEVPSALTEVHATDNGHVLLTTWNGRLHEVVYQTPSDSEADSLRRNEALFAGYGEGQTWKEILDNGFGKIYRRADGQRYAMWSYAMDFITFGTTAFQEAGP
jgi:hypothetical protein